MDNQQSEKFEFIRYAILVLIAGTAIIISWFGFDYFEQNLKPRELVSNLKSGTLLPQPKPIRPFILTDQDEKSLTQDNLRGQWTFIAIGYISCPDICPTLMATFKSIDRLIATTGKISTNFLFISVDPARDSPKQIGSYVHYFNPRFWGATGSNNESINAFTGQFGLFYRRVDGGKTATSYLIDHSAAMMLVNPAAELTAVFSTPHDPQLIAEDFSTLVTAYQTMTIKDEPH